MTDTTPMASDLLPHRKISRPVLWAAIISSMLILVTRSTEIFLEDWIGPFRMLPLIGFVLLVFLGCLIWSIVFLVRNERRLGFRALVPATIQLLAVGAAFLPIGTWETGFEFRHNLADREEVVRLVAAGELKPNVYANPDLIRLPEKYRHLSSGGGEVMVEGEGENLHIMFYVVRGILGDYSGLMYRADKGPPQNGNFGSEFFNVRKLRDHWYFVAAS